MKIARADTYRFTVPLTGPIQPGSEYLLERQGLLVRLTDDAGHTGWGEASPLPGFSTETIEDAEEDLCQVCSQLPGRSSEFAWRSTSLIPVSASVRFAIETAAVNLEAAYRQTPPARLLNPTLAEVVTLNALLDGDPDEVIRNALRKLEQGYRIFKVKVGRRSPGDESIMLDGLLRAIGDAARLRLDANRAWDWDAAMAFAGTVNGAPIEYIEEPLRDPGQLADYARRTGLPLALDESAVDLNASDLHIFQYAKAIVLKPTLIGGIARTLEMAAGALALGIQPVLSSAYESGVGLSMLVALAAASGSPLPTAGLDTYDRLASDVLASPLTPANGCLPGSIVCPAVREDILERTGTWTQ